MNIHWHVLLPEPNDVFNLVCFQVHLHGSGFVGRGYQKCRFNETVMPATILSSTVVSCVAPASKGEGNRGTLHRGEGGISVAIALEGQHWITQKVPQLFTPSTIPHTNTYSGTVLDVFLQQDRPMVSSVAHMVSSVGQMELSSPQSCLVGAPNRTNQVRQHVCDQTQPSLAECWASLRR